MTKTLRGLPDELLMEILQHLSTIRSYETQSAAFKHKQVEKARQQENHVRRLTLYNLCLASKHVRRIATPVLYSSFTGAATWHGIEPLRLFHRTISEAKASVGDQFKHADCLQYVENRLSDYRGNNLYADTELPDSLQMVARYFYLLADIVSHAANIQHLSVTSMETREITFWGYILPGHHGVTVLARHAFRKLQTLCLQMHTRGYIETVSFRQIRSAMTSVPLLSDFRASGVMDIMPTSRALAGSYQRLQRLEIIECVLDLKVVGQMWSACEGLRHIVCSWAFLDCESEVPSDLYPALLSQRDTLETLYLDFRDVRFDDDLVISQCLGILQPFTRLKSLAISENGFLGEPSPFAVSSTLSNPPRIAAMLPSELDSFTLLLDTSKREAWDERMDDSVDMWNLATDYRSSTLSLKELIVKGQASLREAPRLTLAFSEVGVGFQVVVDQ